MKGVHIAAALLSLASPALAFAQDAAPAAAAAGQAPTAGAAIKTGDNWPLGRIQRVNLAKDGSVESVSVIYDGRMIYVPGSTLTVTDKAHVATSLTHKQVGAL